MRAPVTTTLAALFALSATAAHAAPVEEAVMSGIDICRAYVATPENIPTHRLAKQKGFRGLPAETPHYMWSLDPAAWPADTVEIVTDTQDGPSCLVMVMSAEASDPAFANRLKGWAKAQGYVLQIENHQTRDSNGETMVADVLARPSDSLMLSRPADPKSETAFTIVVSK